MDLLDGNYTILWVVWILGFLGIEAAALFNKKRGDTLSEHVWALIGNTKRGYPKTKTHKVARGALAALLAWLGFHFFGGSI